MSRKKPQAPNRAQQREGPDPDENNPPLPWYLIMFLGAMAMWGAFYIYETPSGTDTLWGDQRSVEALMAPAPAGEGGAAVDGAAVFGAKCAACHQGNGMGVPGVFPPLAGADWVTGSDKRLIQILLHGITGEIEVKGVVYKGAMPAFNNLSDAEIAAVTTHIRSQWGNTGSVIKSELVSQQREATKTRATPYAGGAELKTVE
ncbi:MAG: cytochrome c [Polaromonas sp.]